MHTYIVWANAGTLTHPDMYAVASFDLFLAAFYKAKHLCEQGYTIRLRAYQRS